MKQWKRKYSGLLFKMSKTLHVLHLVTVPNTTARHSRETSNAGQRRRDSDGK